MYLYSVNKLLKLIVTLPPYFPLLLWLSYLNLWVKGIHFLKCIISLAKSSQNATPQPTESLSPGNLLEM